MAVVFCLPRFTLTPSPGTRVTCPNPRGRLPGARSVSGGDWVMLRRVLLFAVAVLLLPAMLAPTVANAATTTGCTDGVAVTQFAFNPPSVGLTGSSALTLVLQN